MNIIQVITVVHCSSIFSCLFVFTEFKFSSMEAHRHPEWDTRKGRTRYANKQLRPFRKRISKSKVLSIHQKKTKLAILNDCQKLLERILKFKAPEKPPGPDYNKQELHELISVIPDVEDVHDWIENGISTSVPNETFMGNYKRPRSIHECFNDPIAIKNFLQTTLEELEKGFL